MAESRSDEVTISIYSTRDRYSFGPACQIVWQELEWYASVEEVRRTSLHLILCAAYGDMIGELLKLGLDAETVTRLASGVLSTSPAVAASRRKHEAGMATLGSKHTLLVMPTGSSARKAGGVRISRGGKVLDMGTDDATRMAKHWLEAAEASDSDTLFSQVVERSGLLSEFDVDALFGLLHDIRSGQASPPPARTQQGA
jgi:hypothetical protein